MQNGFYEKKNIEIKNTNPNIGTSLVDDAVDINREYLTQNYPDGYDYGRMKTDLKYSVENMKTMDFQIQ